MGKGSKRRPQQVTNKQFDDNWYAIFNKKQQQAEAADKDRQARKALRNYPHRDGSSASSNDDVLSNRR